jgi:hypothetical protein
VNGFMFEAIAAQEENRVPDFTEIKSHMSPEQRAGFDEMVRRTRERRKA